MEVRSAHRASLGGDADTSLPSHPAARAGGDGDSAERDEEVLGHLHLAQASTAGTELAGAPSSAQRLASASAASHRGAATGGFTSTNNIASTANAHSSSAIGGRRRQISSKVAKELKVLEKELDSVSLGSVRYEDLQAIQKQKDKTFALLEHDAEKTVRIASTDFLTPEQLDVVRLREHAAGKVTSTAGHLHIHSSAVLPNLERSKQLDTFVVSLLHYFRAWLMQGAVQHRMDEFYRAQEIAARGDRRRSSAIRPGPSSARSAHAAVAAAAEEQSSEQTIRQKIAAMAEQLARVKACLQMYHADVAEKYAMILQAHISVQSTRKETTYFETMHRLALLCLHSFFENTEYISNVDAVRREFERMYRTDLYQAPRWRTEQQSQQSQKDSDGNDEAAIPARTGSATVNVRTRQNDGSNIIRDYLERTSEVPHFDHSRLEALGDSLDNLKLIT